MMKITDYSGPKKIINYLEFPGRVEAVRWLKANEFECMPNSVNHDMYLDSFFRSKDRKISVMGWDC